MRGKTITITPGDVFGRLTVIGPAGKYREALLYECRCQCGNTPVVRGHHLADGRTQSCGCLRRECNHEYGLSGAKIQAELARRSRPAEDRDPAAYGCRVIVQNGTRVANGD